TVQEADAGPDVLRGEALDGRRELALHDLELLVRDEAQAHLRGRRGGDDGLGAVAREPTGDAVDLERGQGPQPLQHGIRLEPGEGFGLDAVLEKLALFER